jgi:hypothetical protein
MLGAIRIADHEMRCAEPCPAPEELAPIVALLAAGRAKDGAGPKQLYPYAMTVDKLYDHTHDPADIDLALHWLSRAVADRRLPTSSRRRAWISLAIQHANRGVTARETQRRSGPGTQSWAVFDAAIKQYEEVLANLTGRGRRSDTTRNEDKLDALLGLLETYYQRDGEHVPAEDLGIMATLARTLVAAMTNEYRLRSYALGHCGVALMQRITRDLGEPWNHALSTAIRSRDASPIHAVLTRVNNLDTDLGIAIGALAVALGLEDITSHQLPLFAAAMCTARALRFLAHGGEEDLRELGRLCRLVMGHPGTDPSYRRMCSESLLVVLARHLRTSSASPAAAPLGPSDHADLDTIIGLLTQFAAADGQTLDPALSWALTAATGIRGGGELSDPELAFTHSRQQPAADSYAEFPAVHAALLPTASAGTEAVHRGNGATRRADQIATAPPTALGAFGVQTLGSPGAAVYGRPAVPTGKAAEIAESLLAGSTYPAVAEAAVRSVPALALCTRWLRERNDEYLVRSISQLRHAIDLVKDGHPLRTRLFELLAGILLDRAWVRGDHADANAALALLTELDAGRGSDRETGDLNVPLARAGPTALRQLLTTPSGRQPDPAAGASAYVLERRTLTGSALLLRALLSGSTAAPLRIGSPQGADDLSCAIDLLCRVEATLPANSTHRPEVLSDLGLARLADGLTQAWSLEPGAWTMRAAVAACPPGFPRRASILARTAAAIVANAHASYVPHLIDESVNLLTQALRSAGLERYGKRSRCLYGLGYPLLTRFEQTGQGDDLSTAIQLLEEARACLEPNPGDPFMVPLLRLLAWAYRRAATDGGLGLHRSQARSIGRSVLHAQARSVLLQSRSKNAVAATRSLSEDALRLAAWCLADGRDEAAVEALELGRALVLHAATTAADVPMLLRDANHQELAAEWEADQWRDIDAVPSDLRHRVLSALSDGPAEQRLLAVPTVSQIAATLRSLHMDALVYLIPSSNAIDGCAVIVRADGKAENCRLPDLVSGPDSVVADFAAAHRTLRADDADHEAVARFRDQLRIVCDWAWRAAIGPLLNRIPTTGPEPVHLVLAPMGILASSRGTLPGTDRVATFVMPALTRFSQPVPACVSSSKRPPGSDCK